MNNHEQLHIGFLIFVGDRLYSERELSIRFTEIDKAVDEHLIDVHTPDGVFSIQYLDEELWPPELWTEINLFSISTDLILRGNDKIERLDSQHASIQLRRVEDYLFYHLKSTPPSSKHEITRILPLGVFIREWTLMRARMYKFIAYLRREKFDGNMWYFEHASSELRRIVGDERMRSVAAQDLVEMLSSSPCTQGYLCQEDQTFVKVPFGAPNPLYSA